jgi:hypothetical protein
VFDLESGRRLWVLEGGSTGIMSLATYEDLDGAPRIVMGGGVDRTIQVRPWGLLSAGGHDREVAVVCVA